MAVILHVPDHKFLVLKHEPDDPEDARGRLGLPSQQEICSTWGVPKGFFAILSSFSGSRTGPDKKFAFRFRCRADDWPIKAIRNAP